MLPKIREERFCDAFRDPARAGLGCVDADQPDGLAIAQLDGVAVDDRRPGTSV